MQPILYGLTDKGEEMTINQMMLLLRIYNREEMSRSSLDSSELEAIDSLWEKKLIEHNDSEKWPFISTFKGDALIDEWLNTPMPVAVWRVER